MELKILRYLRGKKIILKALVTAAMKISICPPETALDLKFGRCGCPKAECYDILLSSLEIANVYDTISPGSFIFVEGAIESASPQWVFVKISNNMTIKLPTLLLDAYTEDAIDGIMEASRLAEEVFAETVSGIRKMGALSLAPVKGADGQCRLVWKDAQGLEHRDDLFIPDEFIPRIPDLLRKGQSGLGPLGMVLRPEDRIDGDAGIVFDEGLDPVSGKWIMLDNGKRKVAVIAGKIEAGAGGSILIENAFPQGWGDRIYLAVKKGAGSGKKEWSNGFRTAAPKREKWIVTETLSLERGWDKYRLLPPAHACAKDVLDKTMKDGELFRILEKARKHRRREMAEWLLKDGIIKEEAFPEFGVLDPLSETMPPSEIVHGKDLLNLENGGKENEDVSDCIEPSASAAASDGGRFQRKRRLVHRQGGNRKLPGARIRHGLFRGQRKGS